MTDSISIHPLILTDIVNGHSQMSASAKGLVILFDFQRSTIINSIQENLNSYMEYLLSIGCMLLSLFILKMNVKSSQEVAEVAIENIVSITSKVLRCLTSFHLLTNLRKLLGKQIRQTTSYKYSLF